MATTEDFRDGVDHLILKHGGTLSLRCGKGLARLRLAQQGGVAAAQHFQLPLRLSLSGAQLHPHHLQVRRHAAYRHLLLLPVRRCLGGALEQRRELSTRHLQLAPRHLQPAIQSLDFNRLGLQLDQQTCLRLAQGRNVSLGGAADPLQLALRGGELGREAGNVLVALLQLLLKVVLGGVLAPEAAAPVHQLLLQLRLHAHDLAAHSLAVLLERGDLGVPCIQLLQQARLDVLQPRYLLLRRPLRGEQLVAEGLEIPSQASYQRLF